MKYTVVVSLEVWGDVSLDEAIDAARSHLREYGAERKVVNQVNVHRAGEEVIANVQLVRSVARLEADDEG